jgi:hypothetical protein
MSVCQYCASPDCLCVDAAKTLNEVIHENKDRLKIECSQHATKELKGLEYDLKEMETSLNDVCALFMKYINDDFKKIELQFKSGIDKAKIEQVSYNKGCCFDLWRQFIADGKKEILSEKLDKARKQH